MLSEKITELKKELVEYAMLVEEMVDLCMKGLLRRDKKLLEEVLHKDEPRVNQEEIALDERGLSLIAQYSPKAKELRTILMILEMNKDLERMADHAVNIAESALFLIERPAVKPLIDIPRMSELAVLMMKDSISAFIDDDPQKAHDICLRDDMVDALREQILRELITYMSADPSTIERSIHLIRIANNLERIADLATNICEEVIFIVEGKVIKHHQEEKENPEE